MSGSEKKPAVSQRIVEFIQRNRKPIWISAAAAALLLVAGLGALIGAGALRGRAIAAAEDLGDRFEALRPAIFWGEEDAAGEVDALAADLRAFAARNSRFAGSRAWSMLAGIYGERGQWAQAEDAWLSAAGASPRTYIEPVALFNAGAAAEEQGQLERAISHYAASAAAPDGFFAAPRAQFSIARIHEAMGNGAEALLAYRAIVADWPQDPVWPNLARSRIIALETSASRLADPPTRPDPWAAFDFGGDWEGWDDEDEAL
jgi:tetratricopeptide (TPR) repeat protein